MERTRQADVKVGIFVLLALGLLVAGSLWIAGSSWTGRTQSPYTVLMRDSGGVQAGDRVRFAGVAVGRVLEVRLQPEISDWPVRIDVAVAPEIPVRADSDARIVSVGLLGSSLLTIGAGSPEEPLLAPGGEIHGTPTAGLDETLAHVDQIGEMAINLLDQMSVLLAEVSREIGPLLDSAQQFTSGENAENVRVMLASMRELTTDVSPRVVKLLERLEDVAADLDDDLEALPELAGQATELLARLQEAVGPDGERLTRVLDAAESGLESADETLSTLAVSRQEVEWTLRDLREAVANLKAFSQEIKERPFSLVRIKVPEERRPGQDVARGTP